MSLITLLASLAIGVGLGYLLSQYIERHKTGGKTASEILAEHKEFREQVNRHFTQTSELFQNLTGQYRELYDHLSQGARSLCESIPNSPRLGLADKGLLPQTPIRSETANAATLTSSSKPAVSAPPSNHMESTQIEESVRPASEASAEDEHGTTMGAEASVAVETNLTNTPQISEAAGDHIAGNDTQEPVSKEQ